jgi:hypothetical protein
MKYTTFFFILASCIFAYGCQTPHSVPPVANVQVVKVTSSSIASVKTCEEILLEEATKGWHKYEAQTSYPGFVENLDLIEKIVGELNVCIVGKNQEFVTELLGKPSHSSTGIFRYVFYQEQDNSILKAKCLVFRMKDSKTISSVSYEDCGVKRL